MYIINIQGMTFGDEIVTLQVDNWKEGDDINVHQMWHRRTTRRSKKVL